MIPGWNWRFLEPASPVLLVTLLILAALALRLYQRTEPPLAALVRLGLFTLRSAAIGLLALLLLDPILSRFRERRVLPAVPVLLDTSLSMSIPFPRGSKTATEPAAETPPTRASRLLEVLSDKGANLLEKLGNSSRPKVYGFGETTSRLAWVDPTEELSPREDRTDLAGALETVGREEAQSIGAVIVFSDGAQNVGSDPRAVAKRLGVPVYTVGVGAEGDVSDVSVFEVDASNVAYVDNEVPLLAKLRARGDTVSRLPVYLSEGNDVLDSAYVDLPGGGVEKEVELRYTPKREGVHRYRIWTPGAAGEVSALNNEQTIAVRVLKEKIKVLLAAGRPSFELTFLKRALESDVTLDVKTAILSLAEFPGRLGKGSGAFPDTYAKMAAHDLIVLADVRRGDLSESQMQHLARVFADRRGALLLLGGAKSFEFTGTPLAELAPWSAPQPARSVGRALPVELTEVGRTHPVTNLDNDPQKNARLWGELPPLEEWARDLRLHPRARVLLKGATGQADDSPVVAAMESRQGRVLAVAGGPFWRWELYLQGREGGSDTYRKFISRCVRWLVARDELKQVAIRPSKPLFDGAEPVVLQGQIMNDDYQPISGADVRVTLEGPTGSPDAKTREVTLIDQGHGRSEGVFRGLPPGDYVAEGRAMKDGVELGSERSELTVTPFRMEFEDPAPNFELLREMARTTGGEFVTLEEAAGLVEKLQLQPVTERSTKETPLRESPYAFAFLLGCLGTEWALRKRRGLP